MKIHFRPFGNYHVNEFILIAVGTGELEDAVQVLKRTGKAFKANLGKEALNATGSDGLVGNHIESL